ncbi:MAG: coiled-coil domain-containing protein [Gammaproteobacteria bacterium]
MLALRLWAISTAMNAIAFDTLKFAKRLKEAGFTEQQAEALASAEAEFIEHNLATKRDILEVKRELKEVETGLRRELKEVEAGLKRDIKELEVKIEQIRSDLTQDIKELETKLARDMKDLEYRMTIKLGAMLVVAVGAMATLAKLL